MPIDHRVPSKSDWKEHGFEVARVQETANYNYLIEHLNFLNGEMVAGGLLFLLETLVLSDAEMLRMIMTSNELTPNDA